MTRSGMAAVAEMSAMVTWDSHVHQTPLRSCASQRRLRAPPEEAKEREGQRDRTAGQNRLGERQTLQRCHGRITDRQNRLIGSIPCRRSHVLDQEPDGRLHGRRQYCSGRALQHTEVVPLIEPSIQVTIVNRLWCRDPRGGVGDDGRTGQCHRHRRPKGLPVTAQHLAGHESQDTVLVVPPSGRVGVVGGRQAIVGPDGIVPVFQDVAVAVADAGRQLPLAVEYSGPGLDVVVDVGHEAVDIIVPCC